MNLGLEFNVVWIVFVLLCGNRYKKIIANDFVHCLNYIFRIGEESLQGIKYEQTTIVRIWIYGKKKKSKEK